jgi:hypothetical protein
MVNPKSPGLAETSSSLVGLISIGFRATESKE